MRFLSVLLGLALLLSKAIPAVGQDASVGGSSAAGGLRNGPPRHDFRFDDDDECISKRWCDRIRGIYKLFCVDYPFGFCKTLEVIHDDYCWDTTIPLEEHPDVLDEKTDGVYTMATTDRFFRRMDELDTDRLREVDPSSEGRLTKRQSAEECEFSDALCDKMIKYKKLFCDDPDLEHKQLCKMFTYFDWEYCFW